MNNVLRFLVGAAAIGFTTVASTGSADSGHLHPSSVESLSSPDTIRSMFGSNGQAIVAPTRIWKVLEHGEKVECLSCIPLVSGLLYESSPKTREIAAWWLRRRIFGVFGPGQIYSQVIDTLNDANQTEVKRARAANALGEFLTPSAVRHLARAIREDGSPAVREASVLALQRLNNEGPNSEIAFAMSDSDGAVRLSAIRAAMRINRFTSVTSIVERIGDDSAQVRRAAVEALGTMRLLDAAPQIAALVSVENEDDAAVRKAAIWALVTLGDGESRDAIRAALSDPDRFVRDAAATALQRL
jgi:hypothetical protein